MDTEKLTIAKALRYTRHDYLNELQLILLSIDLGKVSEARATVLEATERLRQLANLENLGLPSVELWIHSLDWVYTFFTKRLTCEIEKGVRTADDQQITAYLTSVFSQIETVVDPFTEYEIDVFVQATSSNWSIRFTIYGALRPFVLDEQLDLASIEIEQQVEHEKWIFTLRGR